MDLQKAKELSYENMKNEETEIGFEFVDQWITNPFIDSTGRFEFENINAMYNYYGKENVDNFLKEITEGR